MAQTEDNIKGDIWEVYIDDEIAPFYATWDVGENLDVHMVTTQRYGTTPIDALNQGQKCEMQFTFQEVAREQAAMWNGIVGPLSNENALPPVGSKLPKHSVRMHNPSDGADTTNDIYMPKVSFMGYSMSTDGAGNAEHKVAAKAMLDLATGVLSQIGWVED